MEGKETGTRTQQSESHLTRATALVLGRNKAKRKHTLFSLLLPLSQPGLPLGKPQKKVGSKEAMEEAHASQAPRTQTRVGRWRQEPKGK